MKFFSILWIYIECWLWQGVLFSIIIQARSADKVTTEQTLHVREGGRWKSRWRSVCSAENGQCQGHEEGACFKCSGQERWSWSCKVNRDEGGWWAVVSDVVRRQVVLKDQSKGIPSTTLPLVLLLQRHPWIETDPLLNTFSWLSAGTCIVQVTMEYMSPGAPVLRMAQTPQSHTYSHKGMQLTMVCWVHYFHVFPSPRFTDYSKNGPNPNGSDQWSFTVL